MATVVTLARASKTIAAQEFLEVEIVDGQQRVTTLVILLKAIEKRLSESLAMEAHAKRELGFLLVKADEHSLVLLQTNHDSSNVFTSYIRTGEFDHGAVQTASDQNLVEAMRDCEEFVASWVTKGQLIELLSTVRNRLFVIYHQLSDEATVYRVFEVLNSRGLDVRWIDKTKSQMMATIFESSGDGNRVECLNEMKIIWQGIYRVLGFNLSLGDEALRFAGTLISKARPNRVLSEEDASIAMVLHGERELSRTVKSAEWLFKIVRLVNELNSDMRRTAVTRIAHARFVAISIMARDFDEKTKNELLNAWEKVTFRIFGLHSADSRNKVGDYVRLAYDVLVSNLSIMDIRKRLSLIGEGYEIEKMPEDDDEYWDNCYDGWSEELRYILFRYEEYLSNKSGEKLNQSQWNKIWLVEPSRSIEHISPQSDNEEFRHHLGNLTMLPPSVNSSLQDKSAIRKADTYIKCGIRETISVGERIKETGRWTRKDVKARAKRILKFARTEWAE